jgi:hypothetical protein
MSSTDGRCVTKFQGPCFENLQKALEICKQKIGGSTKLNCKSGVHHIGRGEPSMKMTALLSDILSHTRDEGNHIMANRFLNLMDARDIEPSLLPKFPGRFFRNLSKLRPRSNR